MKILIATINPAKFSEYSYILRLSGYEPLSLLDLTTKFGAEPPEDKPTIEENARNKAKYYAKVSELITLSSDMGYSVEKYKEEWNKIIRLEPRRLGLGRRVTDRELIDWHNKKLRQVGGQSLAKFDIAMAIAHPNGKVCIGNFSFQTLLLERKDGFPPIREGYPLDSQSKSVTNGKFICDILPGEELPVIEMVDFIKKSMVELV